MRREPILKRVSWEHDKNRTSTLKYRESERIEVELYNNID